MSPVEIERVVAAVVLAAGGSKRMGQPKMVLPWGEDTVIGKVVRTLKESGLVKILVVTGGTSQLVEKAVNGLAVQVLQNPDYSKGDMLISCQVGLQGLDPEVEAAFIVLGDQPQIEARVVKSILHTYASNPALLLVPSYQMHRGHPWIVARSLWPAIMELRPPQTLKDFLAKHADQITYLPTDSASVLQDLDTPEDYARYSQRRNG